jgi:hypothetical protein
MWYAGRAFKYVGFQDNTAIWVEVEAVCGVPE